MRVTAHNIRQLIKWMVYALLLVNFAFYILDDLRIAQHTLRDGWTILDWTEAFGTSLDEAAWFALLFLFELETYVLSDEVFKGAVKTIVHGIRAICYVFLAHTIYAWGMAVVDIYPDRPVADVDNLCELVDQDISYTFNLEYTLIDVKNCSELSEATGFYYVDDNNIVSDAAGLRIERQLAWVDLIEAVTWLLVVLTIEVIVRLQARGVTGGPLIAAGNHSKVFLYGILFAAAGYWFYQEHWLYVWDELLWIGGFAAIEMNVVGWREELLEQGEKETNGDTV